MKTQSERVHVLKQHLQRDSGVDIVVDFWNTHRRNIQPKLNESLELRNFIFATDTTTTSNAELGEFAWKNNTHLPKLCEIRDSLLEIYKATWFPNDFWMKWEAYSLDEEVQEKKRVIEGYMRNKVRMCDFEKIIGEKGATDLIDYGNAFVGAYYRDDTLYNKDGTVRATGYKGPAPYRISPNDIVFNLTAESFKDSPKVIRSMKTIGDLALAADLIERTDPEQATKIRAALKNRHEMCQFSVDDFEKAQAYSVDGFGNYYDYLNSGCVEILEYRGTMYVPETGELKRDYSIKVMDRTTIIEEGPWDTRLRDGGIYHVAYRQRPDNLWGMGPLDNLVGMQYRIDHLQGAKDDNVDLHIHPVKIITGDPDETDYGPNKEIRLNADAGESVTFDRPDLSLIGNIDAEINYLIQLMEEFAGSPKQSRGFRTPGEKTLGEVTLLEGNANRLFLGKAMKFEKELIEPVLNAMLEIGRTNLDGKESITIFDDELSQFVMLDITEADLQADGNLVPIGARHFGQRNQQLQNLIQLYNSRLGDKIDPHISSEHLAALIRDNLQIERFGVMSPYSAIWEQGEAARVTQQVQRELAQEAAVETEMSVEERDV